MKTIRQISRKKYGSMIYLILWHIYIYMYSQQYAYFTLVFFCTPGGVILLFHGCVAIFILFFIFSDYLSRRYMVYEVFDTKYLVRNLPRSGVLLY